MILLRSRKRAKQMVSDLFAQDKMNQENFFTAAILKEIFPSW